MDESDRVEDIEAIGRCILCGQWTDGSMSCSFIPPISCFFGGSGDEAVEVTVPLCEECSRIPRVRPLVSAAVLSGRFLDLAEAGATNLDELSAAIRRCFWEASATHP